MILGGEDSSRVILLDGVDCEGVGFLEGSENVFILFFNSNKTGNFQNSCFINCCIFHR